MKLVTGPIKRRVYLTDYKKIAVLNKAGKLVRIYWQHPTDWQSIEMPELLEVWRERGVDDRPIADCVQLIHDKGYVVIVNGHIA